MASGYTIQDQFAQHFITFTVHQWVDVFTRRDYADIFLESIRYCQQHKGLRVSAWVIMSNHVHMIVSSEQVSLSDIIRDLKKYTAKQIVRAIEENPRESRKKWMLWLFKTPDGIWFWEEGYHGEEILSERFFRTKLNYIHQNPVRAGWVESEAEYLYSSAGDYHGVRKGLLDLTF